MEKVFALHPGQQEQIDKWCFGECGKIILGALTDPELGCLYPCSEEICIHEKKNMEYGETESGNPLWLRILEGD